jgi:hypothetical protein
MEKVLIVGGKGTVFVKDALNENVLKEFSTVFEAIKYSFENNLQIPDQAYNGEFIRDENGYIYFNGKDFEYANGDLLLDTKRCNNCGWITKWNEILDENKNTRECYICPKCGFIEACNPIIEEMTEGE